VYGAKILCNTYCDFNILFVSSLRTFGSAGKKALQGHNIFGPFIMGGALKETDDYRTLLLRVNSNSFSFFSCNYYIGSLTQDPE